MSIPQMNRTNVKSILSTSTKSALPILKDIMPAGIMASVSNITPSAMSSLNKLVRVDPTANRKFQRSVRVRDE